MTACTVPGMEHHRDSDDMETIGDTNGAKSECEPVHGWEQPRQWDPGV